MKPKPAYAWPRLVTIREALGMRQVDFAKLLQIGERTLIRWEAEGIPPGPAAVLYGLLEQGLWRP